MKAFDLPRELLAQTSLVDRFLRYVQIDTQSDELGTECPSTAKQLDLGRLLVGELKDLGMEAVGMDEHGYVTAELKGNAHGRIGLCAHMDTAPAFSGTHVQPQQHRDYDGSVIRLKNNVTIDPRDNPVLLDCIGHTIITSDGTTLLGADDKAGVAAILGALETLQANPDIKRPTVRVCFTPDEEVGRGADHFPLEAFDCPVAFTVDGGFPGEINVETFSAHRATICFTGVAVHPGTAKHKMVNALTYMGKFLARMPMAETPECTEGREGFYHPTDISGDAAQCTVKIIIRDFNSDILAQRGRRLRTMAEALTAEEPRLQVSVHIKPQYRNMYESLSQYPEIAERLTTAVQMSGITPKLDPVRGGTDGSRLTEMGMPTPNIFTGGGNFHGPREWISDRALALSACTILNLVQLYGGVES
ncbi:MAG: peptidase T [Phycisphaerae bacterium]|nr:peptidase T [Phycisphaerae bacterium]